MKIYCDDGSTAVKLAWFEGDELKTFVSTNAFKRDWLVDLGGSSTVHNYLIGQQRYTFDKTSPSIKTTTNIDYQYNDFNLLAIHHALLISGIKPQEIDLVVTLPITEFFNFDNTKNTENIERKKQNLLREISGNIKHFFKIKSIIVMPESIPAIGKYLNTHSIHELENTLVIDIGGTTLDCALIAGEYDSISDISGDSKVGVNTVTNAVIECLKSFNMQSNAYVANEILKSKDNDNLLSIFLHDKKSITKMKTVIEQASKVLADLVIEHIQRFTSFNRIILTGGGAPLIEPHIREHYSTLGDNVFIFEDAQIALVSAMAEIEKE